MTLLRWNDAEPQAVCLLVHGTSVLSWMAIDFWASKQSPRPQQCRQVAWCLATPADPNSIQTEFCFYSLDEEDMKQKFD